MLVERVRAIRTAVGPDVRLRLDVNGAWDLATATDRLEAIERFDIEFVEQPLAAHDIDGMAELRRRVRVPIAADEAVDVRARRPRPARGRGGRRPRRQAGAGRRPGRRGRDRRAGRGARRAGRHQHAVRDGDRDRRCARRSPVPLPEVVVARAGPTRSTTGSRRPACSSTTCSRGRSSSRTAGCARPAATAPAGSVSVLDPRALERFRVDAVGVARMTAPTRLAASLAASARDRCGGPGACVASRGRRRDRPTGRGPSSTGAPTRSRAACSTPGVEPGDRVALLAAPSAARHRRAARDRPGGGGGGAGRDRPDASRTRAPRRRPRGARRHRRATASRRPVRASPIGCFDLDALVDGEARRRARSARDPAAPAVAILTSGTTGPTEGGRPVDGRARRQRRVVARRAAAGDRLAARGRARPRRGDRRRVAGCAGGRPARRPGPAGAGGHRRRAGRRSRSEPRLARADDARPDPRRDRRRAATGDPSRGPARWRTRSRRPSSGARWTPAGRSSRPTA